MKQLQKSDLKEGDIYVSNSSYGSYEYLNKHSLSGRGFGLDLTLKNDFRSGWYLSYVNIREATPEEKHWLETCIKADKFVSYEEAMKTFVPEFVLPEKWYIKARLLNDDQLQKLVDYLKILNKSSIYCVENIKKHFPIIGSDKGSHYITSDTNMLYYSEITFDQFEQYVLKEEKEIVTVKATVETKSKFINNNTVETSEGSIFKVGDLVTPFENSNPNKGKKFKITGFRWNNSQTEICAITDLHKPYGIGVEKLEIYLESKVKVKDDFVLPEKWCVKNTDFLIYNFFDSKLKYTSQCYNNPIHQNNYLHSIDFAGNNVINSQIGANVAYNYVKPDYTEITFKQFKKYVLNEKI